MNTKVLWARSKKWIFMLIILLGTLCILYIVIFLVNYFSPPEKQKSKLIKTPTYRTKTISEVHRLHKKITDTVAYYENVVDSLKNENTTLRSDTSDLSQSYAGAARVIDSLHAALNVKAKVDNGRKSVHRIYRKPKNTCTCLLSRHPYDPNMPL